MFEQKTEAERELNNLKFGQEMREIESIFYDGKKEKKRILLRIKKFLKNHRNIRVIIQPNQITLQDRTE